ncbi:PREDICTED: properdin-like [Atta cephalotes]|uniref:CCN TSP1 domain-containing protein n=1 Tax=Atta cephalotes TaxID=12957 RepID=A0A158NEI4_ATTCE|nr:PREDICTED: properdin-like [Atta cephalotes]XP_018052051.1 PREDICTED: properdin-like [Atta colombica]
MYPMRYSRFKRIPHEITQMRVSSLIKKKRDAITKETSNNKNIDWTAWDNWSIWSACSVSCGQGRQVRWRHCLSADCTKGLKKAQLKSCYLKNCGTKGILGWLGIKS